MNCKTITITINLPAKDVYAFVSDLANLPKWAPAFVRSIKRKGDYWIAQTVDGVITMRMTPKNELGVVDHYVIPAPGVEIYVPMRVISMPWGCEVLFTLIQAPPMTDEQFKRDQELVQRDLASLKKVMEA